jgi:signal transduction histidine kinase
MEHDKKEIVFIVLTVTLFVLLFGCMMIMVILNYFKRKKSLILEKIMLEEKFKQEILLSQIEIQNQTFNNISQEIHDNVGQVLSLAKVQLNIIGENQIVNQPLLADTKENISKALSDLRDVAKGLSSDRINILGLDEAIGQELQRINKSGILTIAFNSSGQSREIDQKKQLILYRVIQECLQNIIKHAEASSVNLALDYQSACLDILLSDNGIGFNLEQEQANKHGLGLMNIYKRIELIGGSVQFKSKPREGTHIKISVPNI